MSKAFRTVCGDVPGHEGCAFEVQSDDEAEVIRAVQRHARSVHEEMFSRDEVRGILREVAV